MTQQVSDQNTIVDPGYGFNPLSVCILVAFIGLILIIHFYGYGHDALGYERQTLVAEPWQALTAMLPHLNVYHLGLNLSALVLIYLLFSEATASLFWILALIFSSITSSFGLYFYSPEIEWCVGLSGALHGLFVYVVLRARAHWIWLILIAAKLLVEQMEWLDAAALSSVSVNFIQHAVIVDSHLWGAAGGFFFYGIARSIVIFQVLVELNSDRISSDSKPQKTDHK